MFLLKKSLRLDLKKIGDCHKSCFKDSFSVKLGDGYINKSFEWFLTADNRFLHHVEDDNGNLTGYCGGFISRQLGDGSTSGMMQYAMGQAAMGIMKKPWLLFNKELRPFYPLVIKNIIKKLFFSKSQTNTSEAVINLKKKIGLVVIGVHPDHRGKGIFEMLMKNFEAEAIARKINKLSLSVKSNNARAIAAYKNAGWQVLSNENNGLIMTKVLPVNEE